MKSLKYCFERPTLRVLALTLEANERLDSLGDAVLDAISRHVVFYSFPQFQEGHLSEAQGFLKSDAIQSPTGSPQSRFDPGVSVVEFPAYLHGV